MCPPSVALNLSTKQTARGTVDDEEGDMRRRGARECEEALMEATEARRGYARVAAWDEGNLIQAMARLKNPTIAWRYGVNMGMDDIRDIQYMYVYLKQEVRAF